jgi:hypothetical protein
MGYYIYAWLEDANPQLQIVDAQSGAVCISWSYQDSDSGGLGDRKEIKNLFRDLLLLTCKQELNNSRIFKAEPARNSGDCLEFDELA